MISTPLRERWQPLRGGLINLFKFEDQVFHYENGHLLLRGDNGSGKSRVLALQLPFLLDGDLSPYRVEPDRDPAKRMEWHLLMGGKYERRTGYTWIEFGRVDEDGAEHYLTLGCGMEAKKGGGPPERWFFLSPLRVGPELPLVQNNTPLSRRQLASFFADAAGADGGPAGEILPSRAKYRKAVDEALFRLGSRYDPLIDLLIQLRQPQLMRDLNEDSLSDALSNALAPVDAALIAEVAESFQGLDSDRQRTDEYRQMLESVEAFRENYRRYLAVAVRRLCTVVRTGHSQFEHAARDLRQIEDEASANETKLAESRSLRDEAASRLAGLTAEVATLRDRPEMRDKDALDRALDRAKECADEASAAEREAARATTQWQKEQAERERRESETAREREALAALHRELGGLHQPLATRGEALFPLDTSDPEANQRETGSFAETHAKNLRHLRARNEAIAAKRSDEERRREQSEQARERLDEASDSVREGEKRLETAIDAFGKGVAAWEASLGELTPGRFPRGTDWREPLAAWLEDLDRSDEFAFSTALAEAHRDALAALEREGAALENEGDALAAELSETEAERDRLRDGEQEEPPAPRTRDPRPADRPGAPFWKWFEFRAEIPEDEYAGWESALESAGLLDAWIYPDGRIDIGGEADAFLGLGGEMETGEAGESESLAAILEVADHADRAGPHDAVARLLRRIGNHPAAARCWVSREGAWANGLHHGLWQKADAEFLGHRAREAARLRKLAELEARISDLRSRIDDLDRQRTRLGERIERLEHERRTAPTIRDAHTAALALGQAREESQRRRRESIAAEETHAALRHELAELIARRDADASDLALSEWREPEALERFAAQLADFERLAAAFWPEWRRVRDREEELAAARDREESSRLARDESESRLREKRELAESARSRAETLRATVGAAVEEILRRLGIAESAERAARCDRDGHDKAIREAETHAAVLGERRSTACERRESAEASRDRAVARMGDFVAHRLFEELDPAAQPERETFSATAAVELARRFEQQLKEHPESPEHWNRLQTAIAERFNEFADQLGRHGPYPRMERIDESSVCVVRSEFQGAERSVGELHEALAGELENRLRIFEEEERKVIENHLIGEAAVAVRDRIRAGDDWVRDVNGELARVPTSSGIQLKFEWQLAEPDDLRLRSVRELFRKHAATWTLPEREEIGAFLQDRIRDSREEDDSRTWRDHLAEALDYRAWHRFGILRKQSGEEGWKRLTRRTFGTGSGGEKALTLTVPQFAAAAAHYHSAHRHAPRLILLDEVFVGIDADTRARLMGLLETFDLDYVMTSEREWGTYPEVSALAIYQLASRPGFNAVAVTRWVWNGREKLRDPDREEARSTDGGEGSDGSSESETVAATDPPSAELEKP